MKKTLTITTMLLGHASPLLAATPAREDNSTLFVYLFLAFCALIVIAQLFPALMMIFGFAKGVKKAKVATPEAETIPTQEK